MLKNQDFWHARNFKKISEHMQRDPYKSEYKVIKKELTKEDYEKNTLLRRHAKDIKR